MYQWCLQATNAICHVAQWICAALPKLPKIMEYPSLKHPLKHVWALMMLFIILYAKFVMNGHEKERKITIKNPVPIRNRNVAFCNVYFSAISSSSSFLFFLFFPPRPPFFPLPLLHLLLCFVVHLQKNILRKKQKKNILQLHEFSLFLSLLSHSLFFSVSHQPLHSSNS